MGKTMRINTPVHASVIDQLDVRDRVLLSGTILTGRDAALPRLLKMEEKGELSPLGIDLQGAVIFHSAVSDAGLGPTSSNKEDIENSIIPLAKLGVRIHLGKGELSANTIRGLAEHASLYAVIPPVSALIRSCVERTERLLFPELGMEAIYKIEVKDLPILIAASKGFSVYD